LARSIIAKRCKTNGCRTRAGCTTVVGLEL